MAKAILEFDLENPDDKMAHYRCVKSIDMALLLFDLRINFRKNCESILENLDDSKDMFDGANIVFEKIDELFEEHKIDIDELII